MSEAFFRLYQELEREGPGEAADVAWALDLAALPTGAEVCDLGCGSGADLAALCQGDLDRKVVGIERQAQFAAKAQRRHISNPQITVHNGDMTTPGGPYDFVWCAGAAYFLGVKTALEIWGPALKNGGKIAFSEICWWADKSSDATKALWAEYPAMTDARGIGAQVRAAGYRSLATRRLRASAWSEYYDSLQCGIDRMRPGADPDLSTVLDESQAEIDIWRNFGDEYGYLLSVVERE